VSGPALSTAGPEGLGDDETLARRLECHLGEETGGEARVSSLRRLPGGLSWLNAEFSVRGLPDAAAPQEMVLRLGTEGGLFPPYSPWPQVWALQSLEGTGVPAPRVRWAGDDLRILGAPFLVYEKAAGRPLSPWASPGEPPLPDDFREDLGDQFVDALAALHRLDWTQRPVAGLADPGEAVSPADVARRGVAEWGARVERFATRAYPLAHWGLRWLEQHAPAAPRVALLHGDYRTGNFLEQGGRLTAVLDWEHVHLGDPHEDLAWVSLPVHMGGSPHLCRLLEPRRLYERYAGQVGFALSAESVHYYQVFSLLKLAAMHLAAARCFEEGRCNDLRLPALGSQVATCLRLMEREIRKGPAHEVDAVLGAAADSRFQEMP